MGLLDASRLHANNRADALAQAQRQLDALVVKQMLQASGAFKPSASAGASLHADLFVEALAEAVSKSANLAITGAPGPAHPTSPPSGGDKSITTGAPTLTMPLGPGQARLTSAFGGRADPLDGHAAAHAGVDLAARTGTQVLAEAPGVVRHAGQRGGYGEAVEVDHGDGVTTIYAHASLVLVKDGDRVARGQPLALVGATGHATGAHLHFEVRKAGRPMNPVDWLAAGPLPAAPAASVLKIYARRADEQ